MIYRITSKMNDGLADAPPIEVKARDVFDLWEPLYEEMTGDNGELAGPGFTLTVERLS